MSEQQPNPFAIERPDAGEQPQGEPAAEEFASEGDGAERFDVESLTNDQLLDEARQATPEERLHILELLREEGELDMSDAKVRHRWMAAMLEARTLGAGTHAWTAFLRDTW